MTLVRLDWFEFHGAVQVGLARWAQSMNLKDSVMNGERSFMDRLNRDVLGACGERALCKYWGIYWDGSVNTFHRIPDISGYKVEVRTTTRIDGRLIIRNNDADDRIFILITGEGPEFDICGWIFGRKAKIPVWLADPNGYRESWFVPQIALAPVGPLRNKPLHQNGGGV